VSADLAWLLLVLTGMVVGIVGIVLPVLPGLALIAVSQLVWAVVDGHWLSWVAFGLGLAVVVSAWVLMYYLPAKHMRRSGVASWVLAVAAVAGIVGFFVVPVVGLPLFFILAVYVVESIRAKHFGRSLGPTWNALKAAGLSMLIEFSAGMVTIVQWGLLVGISRL
jgi:hypothetical protein